MEEDKIRLYTLVKSLNYSTDLNMVITNQRHQVLHSDITEQDISERCFLTDHYDFELREEKFERGHRVHIQDRSEKYQKDAKKSIYVIYSVKELPIQELDRFKGSKLKFLDLGLKPGMILDLKEFKYWKEHQEAI